MCLLFRQSCTIHHLFSFLDLFCDTHLIFNWSEKYISSQTMSNITYMYIDAYLISGLLRTTYVVHRSSTNTNDFSTRTFIGVRLSGLRRSCTLCSLVCSRFTFSFCAIDNYRHITCMYMYRYMYHHLVLPSPSPQGSFSFQTLGWKSESA